MHRIRCLGVLVLLGFLVLPCLAQDVDALAAQLREGKTSMPTLLNRFQQMMSNEPRNPKWFVLAGALYDRPESKQLFEKALALDSNYVDAYIGLGRLEYRHDNMAAAFAALHRAVSLQPDNQALRLEAIRAAVRSSNVKEARKLTGKDVTAKLEVAQALADEKKYDDAARYLKSVNGGGNLRSAVAARIQFLKAQEAKDKRAQARGLDDFLQAWAADPSDSIYYRWMFPRDPLVRLLSRAQRYADVERVAKRGIELYPEEYSLYEYLWKSWFGEPKTDYTAERERVVQSIEKLLRDRPASPDLLRIAAMGYETAGKAADADLTRKRMVAEFPYSMWSQMQRRVEFLRAKDPNARLAQIEAYMRDFFTMPVYSEYVAAKEELGASDEDLAKAADFAMARTPYKQNTLYDVGQILVRRKTHLKQLNTWFEEVLNDRTEAQDGKPNAWTARLQSIQGKTLLLIGHLGKAEQLLRPIIDLETQGFSNVDRGRARWYLGDCLLAAGKKEEAMEMYAQGFAQSQHYFTAAGDAFRKLYRELNGTDAGIDEYLAARDDMYATAANSGIERGSPINENAPDFNLLTLSGERVSLASLRGKTVVINFWATWCGPCIKELPHFQEFYEKVKDDPSVVFLAITTDENRGLVEPFVKKNKYTFPVAFDESIRGKFGVRGIPATFIVDPNGMTRLRMVGFNQNEPLVPYLLKLVAQYRSKPALAGN